MIIQCRVNGKEIRTCRETIRKLPDGGYMLIAYNPETGDQIRLEKKGMVYAVEIDTKFV